MSPNLQSSFWERMGLNENDRDICYHTIQEIYSEHEVEELDEQGYCSFTFSTTPRTRTTSKSCNSSVSNMSLKKTSARKIIQLRPEDHMLDLSIMKAARRIYGALVPNIHTLDCNTLPRSLQAYEMQMLPGQPLSRHHHRTLTLNPPSLTKQATLLRTFASFLAKVWPALPLSSQTSTSSVFNSQTFPGPVGSHLQQKLTQLSQHLPTHTLRARATTVLQNLASLRNYPVVLNHGDLIPSNILIDPDTFELQGLVDWAEAEFLPFGTCFYGVEFLLGYLEFDNNCDDDGGEGGDGKGRPRFVYYKDTEKLRGIFWTALCKEAVGLEERLEDVRLVRDMGVLLWYGFAWDEGRIDRVVNEREDEVELECLRRFLGVGEM